MEQDYVKRFLTKDGNTRVSIYRDEYAENPRDTTDEPLHCEDWSRDYSIMSNDERNTKSENACKWIRYMLERYGNTKAIIEVLRENARSDKHDEGDNSLVYDKSRHEWILNYWNKPWKDYNGAIHGNCWSEEVSWEVKLKNIDNYNIVPYLSDNMIEEFSDEKYFTDEIKIGSYGFGYHGSISFYDSFGTDSEGICWLEKDEFLKYSGCKEEYWNGKTLTEIEWLCKEIECWADGEVYGFVVEKKITSKIHKEYTNVERDNEEYEYEEWEETDSCWGFYVDPLKKDNLNYILESAVYKIEELDEVA